MEKKEQVYNIGDKVWYAALSNVEKSVECPDCFGTKILTVILGDKSEVTIDCAGCASGYDKPKGYITYREYIPKVRLVTIQRVEIEADRISYGFDNCYSVDNQNIFSKFEDAEKQAIKLSEKYKQEELKKIYKKEKHNRTWAWHVYYHRNCIKRAEEDIIHHTAKLNAAKEKTKEA